MKRCIAAFLATLMVCTTLFTGVSAAEKTIKVTLRIEGMFETKLYKKDVAVTFEGDSLTVSDVVKQLVGKENYVEKAGEYGTYFSQLFGETEYSATAYSGWNYIINGATPSLSASVYTVSAGDNIVFYFGDMDTLVPVVQVLRNGTGGLLKITANSWDEKWEPILINAENVDVVWDGISIGKTDKNGLIALSAQQIKEGEHSYAVSKDGVSVEFMGKSRPMPALLRIESDAKYSIAKRLLFSDVLEEHWAAEFVYTLCDKGTVGGNGDGTFAPEGNVTAFQLSKMMGNIENTEANTPVTRQQAAVMLYEHFIKDLGEQSGVKFADDDKITEKTAVYALAQAGIISGKPGNLFDPEGMLRRDECAKLICLLQKLLAK